LQVNILNHAKVVEALFSRKLIIEMYKHHGYINARIANSYTQKERFFKLN